MPTSESTSHAETFHFRDNRSPHDVQVDLERGWRVVFHLVESSPRLTLRAKDRGEVPVVFLLRFEAALPAVNCYSIHMEVSWAHCPVSAHDYYSKARATWFDYWTRDLTLSDPPAPGSGSEERYRELAAAAVSAEAHLSDVAAIQQAILGLLREGGSFKEHHKEGGTAIWFQRGRFAYGTYGDISSSQTFEDEAKFLDFLRQRFAVDLDVAGEFDAWKDVYRRFQREKPAWKPASRGEPVSSRWRRIIDAFW